MPAYKCTGDNIKMYESVEMGEAIQSVEFNLTTAHPKQW